ncbi:MAG: DUF4382 domain-containing protein [Phycisphaerae bacterium]|nr:DUF4382 domain-containing protein [Phycisphaerae bacterium]
MCSSRVILIVLALVIISPMMAGSSPGGCNGVVPIGADGASGTLKVLITDKPFPFEYVEQAIVTVTRVEVRPAGNAGEDEDASGEEDEAGGGFVTVFESASGRSFDLLSLQNGRVDVLAEARLAPGQYSQIRVTVVEGEIRLRDGRVFALDVPSGEQTGIKLRCVFAIEAGEEVALLLDVDLSRAFSPVPGGAVKHPAEIVGFRFTPSLACRVVCLDQAASISGCVEDPNGFPIPAVAVTVFDQDVEVSSSVTDEDGTFTLVGLPAGTYRLEFTADGYEDTEVGSVSVQAGQATEAESVTLQPMSSVAPTAARTLAGGLLGEVNHALHAPVTLHGTFFSTEYHSGTASDAQTVVDDVFLPRRTVWDRNTVWWVMVGGFINGQYLTVDLGGPRPIDSFVVQANSTESHVLSYWDLDVEAWVVAWSVPRGDVYAYGMESRPDPRDTTGRYVLPSPIVTDRLKFSGAATSGTHLYSVSEIQAFGPALSSPPVANAGGPYAVRDTSWDGAVVVLNGSGSHDPDGDSLLYSWRIGEQEIGAAAQLSWSFPIGSTQVSLTVTDPAGLSDTATTAVTVSVDEVRIDIKPGEEPNNINLKSKGSLPVAFLTDEGFDAATIDPVTVSCDGGLFSGFVKMRGKGGLTPMASMEDVDADGDADLVVHLETSTLPLDGGTTECTLGALTWDGFLVRGRDSVRMVP